jgi:hypothetical protein
VNEVSLEKEWDLWPASLKMAVKFCPDNSNDSLYQLS